MQNTQITVLTPEDPRYPEALREIFDPPEKLYCVGDLSLLNKTSVAVVGSRKCTEYGRSCTMELARKLSTNNICVVSGLAMGIDSFAHLGALEGPGSTIAVLGGGIENIFPKNNRHLREQIASQGLIISEHPGDYNPRTYDFPKRNRIISGLCETTVVVEAAEKSGSLITAEFAMDQNRNVYAVPGNITSTYSQGTNRLIKEGAYPLINFHDIIHDLGIVPKEEEEVQNMLGADEKKIYDLINRWGEVSKFYIYQESGFTEETTTGILMILEMKGLIKSSLGKIYIAK